MEKKILAVCVILSIYVVSSLVYFPGLQVRSFDETIAFDKNKIDSIHIRSNRKEVSITDPSAIDIILDDFAKLELRQRKYESDVTKSAGPVMEEKYYIELEDRGELVELIYLSGNLFKFYGYSTGETTVYEIANDPVLEFPGIFHSLHE